MQPAMQMAFDGLGSMPMARIDNYRQIKQEVVDDEMRKRANRCPLSVLRSSSSILEALLGTFEAC